jgi:hypothetical protein
MRGLFQRPTPSLCHGSHNGADWTSSYIAAQTQRPRAFDMTKLKSVLAGIFQQPEKSAAEQFVDDTLGGVQPQWSEDVVEMLEAYRAELCRRQSDSLASGLRWAVVAVVGITLLATVAADIPRVALGVIQAAVLATALALPRAFTQALAAWRSRQYVDVCLGTARWVLARPPHHTVTADQPLQ